MSRSEARRHHMNVSANDQERALIDGTAKMFGVNNGDFLRAVAIGAINRGSAEALFRRGMESSTLPLQRRAVPGAEDWVQTGELERRRGPWLLRKIGDSTANKPAPDKRNWWYLTNDNDPAINVPMAFKASDARRLAAAYVTDYEEHHEPHSENGSGPRDVRGPGVRRQTQPRVRKPVGESR